MSSVGLTPELAGAKPQGHDGKIPNDFLATSTGATSLAEESGDGVWSLYLGSVLLGKIDERTMKVYG